MKNRLFEIVLPGTNRHHDLETRSIRRGSPMSLSSIVPAATQGDQAFEFLLAEILSCRLAPSTRVRINEIALRLNVSLGSVREALSRLTGEGLVIAQAQKGYTVAAVSKSELIDLTSTRIAIEQLCLCNAMKHGDIEWEIAILGAFHRLQRIPERDPDDEAILNESWSRSHAQFHAALVAGCTSLSLLRIRTSLYAQTERYRRLSLPLRRADRDVDAEHKALMEAVVDRKHSEACKSIAEHLNRTTSILLSSPLLVEG